MKKKKVLIPIDGSDRSLISLKFLKEHFKPEEVEVTLIHVREIVFINGMAVSDEIRDGEVIGRRVLREAKKSIEEFEVKKELSFGYAGDEILNYAEKEQVDIIIMAKNTKKKFTVLMGSVTAHVARKAKCTIIMIPESY